MFKAQCAEENNRTQCAMENSGKREQRVSGRMVPQLGFWFLMEFLEFVAQHIDDSLFGWVQLKIFVMKHRRSAKNIIGSD